MTTCINLNPYSPDSVYPYRDSRTAQAVETAVRASNLVYDPQHPHSREDAWSECLDLARDAAENPSTETTPREVLFAYQLAVRAAVLSHRYDDASQLLPPTQALARQIQQPAE